jgi:phage gp36-like protein
MYATLVDLLEQIPEADLIGLTDDVGTDAVDQTVIDRAVTNAGVLIDNYCRDRYVVPFTPVPDLVRFFACDLAIYNIYSRRGHVEVPEAVKDRQKQALAYLKRVQDGLAGFDGVALATVDSGSSAGIVPGNERLFTRTTMGGF